MPRAYRTVLAERSCRLPSRPSTQTAAVAADSGRAASDVDLEKLDSAQYEPFVAMLDDQPAGVLGLFQTGEVGRLSDLYVAEAARGKGVAAALVTAAIRTARRWSIRYICAQFSRDSAAGSQIEALLKKTGFSVGGTIATLRLPEAGDGNW